MRMRANATEIARAIELNKKLRETLPEFSAFDDANWEKIDAELSILNDALAGIFPLSHQESDDVVGDCAIWLNNTKGSEYLECLEMNFE